MPSYKITVNYQRVNPTFWKDRNQDFKNFSDTVNNNIVKDIQKSLKSKCKSVTYDKYECSYNSYSYVYIESDNEIKEDIKKVIKSIDSKYGASYHYDYTMSVSAK